MVEVTQEHIGWATSIAQHLCHPADRDAAIRLVSDGLARFEQEVLARASTAPDAEPVAVADRPVTTIPVDDSETGVGDRQAVQVTQAWEDRCRNCDDTGEDFQTERRCACQPPLPTRTASAPVATEAMVALRRSRDLAMQMALKARIPECGEFGAIAQDLDFALAAMGERS